MRYLELVEWQDGDAAISEAVSAEKTRRKRNGPLFSRKREQKPGTIRLRLVNIGTARFIRTPGNRRTVSAPGFGLAAVRLLIIENETCRNRTRSL
jgi:hypothetical protein